MLDEIGRVQPSEIRSMFELASKRTVSLDIGKPDFPTPENTRVAQRGYLTEM